jgi:hypothetical protein
MPDGTRSQEDGGQGEINAKLQVGWAPSEPGPTMSKRQRVEWASHIAPRPRLHPLKSCVRVAHELRGPWRRQTENA